MAVSLAKVADVDSGLGNEDMAVDRFQEGIKLLESLTLNSENPGLEQRVRLQIPCLLLTLNSVHIHQMYDELSYFTGSVNLF